MVHQRRPRRVGVPGIPRRQQQMAPAFINLNIQISIYKIQTSNHMKDMKFKTSIIIPLTALLLSACSMTAQVPPANSVEVKQRNAAGDDWVYRLVSPQPNSLLTFGADRTPGTLTIGDGLTIASGTLSAAGGAATLPISGKYYTISETNTPFSTFSIAFVNTVSLQMAKRSSGNSGILTFNGGQMNLVTPGNEQSYINFSNSYASASFGISGYSDNLATNSVVWGKDSRVVVDDREYISMYGLKNSPKLYASATAFGVVKVGSGLEVTDGVISVASGGEAALPIYGTHSSITEPDANTLTISNGGIGSISILYNANYRIEHESVNIKGIVDGSPSIFFTQNYAAGVGYLTYNGSSNPNLTNFTLSHRLRAAYNVASSEPGLNDYITLNDLRSGSWTQASTSQYGVVKVGDGLDVTNGVISVAGGGGGGLPAGGTANQVLVKNSGTDGDAGWKATPMPVVGNGVTISTPYDAGIMLINGLSSSYTYIYLSDKNFAINQVTGNLILNSRDTVRITNDESTYIEDAHIQIESKNPFLIKNAGASAFQRIKAAAPTESDDLVTKGYADANYGGGGAAMNIPENGGGTDIVVPSGRTFKGKPTYFVTLEGIATDKPYMHRYNGNVSEIVDVGGWCQNGVDSSRNAIGTVHEVDIGGSVILYPGIDIQLWIKSIDISQDAPESYNSYCVWIEFTYDE
jgi:hypothetical protein